MSVLSLRGRIMKVFLPSTARGQPFGHITFSNPIFCVLHVIICKALVPGGNTESKQCPGLIHVFYVCSFLTLLVLRNRLGIRKAFYTQARLCFWSLISLSVFKLVLSGLNTERNISEKTNETPRARMLSGICCYALMVKH